MAINSMFRWYKDARVCYVHLADVSYDRYIHDDTSDDAFQTSRWFTRGWTLQELIAPRQVVFFSSDGSYLGCKDTIQRILVKITGIPGCALAGCDLSEFTVAERMSWASARETKLEEDRVYSLLGLFDIHLPPIYGEGLHHARERLRFEIERRTLQPGQPVSEQPDLDTQSTPAQPWHPVRRNYHRVYVKVIYWKADEVDRLVGRLSDVFRKLYLYEVEIICLAPTYTYDDPRFPWPDSVSSNEKNLKIVYYIGATRRHPDIAAKGWPDIQAVSDTLPDQTLEKQDWLSLTLGIPDLTSDSLVILDSFWAGLSDRDSSNFEYLRVGPSSDWARYGVLFAGYEDDTWPRGRFSEIFINVLESLAHRPVGDSNALSSCEGVVNELRESGCAYPDFRGSVRAASIILAPLWA